MKKILLILSFIVAFTNAYSQTPDPPTPGTAPRSNASVIPEDYNLSVRSIILLPRFPDTTLASANTKPLFDTCGRMFFNYTTNSVWVRKCDPKRWEEMGKNLGNSDLIQSSATRTFDFNAGKLHFNNTGRLVIATTDPFPSDNTKFRVYPDNYAQSGLMVTNNRSFDGSSIFGFVWLNDSITNANRASRKGAAFIAQRAYYPASGTSFNNFFNATTLDNVFYVPDTFAVKSWGGDFNSNKIGQFFLRNPSTYTGRSVIGNVGSEINIFETQPGLIAHTTISGSSGNSIRLRGWYSDATAYLLINPTDTIDKHISFLSGGNIVGRVGKQIDFYAVASGAFSVDSAYAFVAPYSKQRVAFNGTLSIGGGVDNEAVNGIFRPVHNSAKVDIWSTTSGVLLPRMNTTAQNAIATPATSLLIYNTDSSKYCFYNGAAWVCMETGSGGSGSQSWEDVMAVSPDITNNYTSDFNGRSWIWNNVALFNLHSDGGSTKRIGITSTLSQLFAPNGTSGIEISNDSTYVYTLGFKADTTVNKPVYYNTLTKSLIYGAAGGGGSSAVTWNAITDPTGVQSLTFQDNENTDWTNLNDDQPFLVITSNSMTSGSVISMVNGAMSSGNMLSLSSTSTTLSTGNEIINVTSSGTNGTSAITATGVRISVTNTGTTSQNIALRATASGGASANYAGYFDNIVSIGAGDIVAGASSSHSLIVRSLDNTSGNGIIVYPNANYGTSTSYGFAAMTASADYTMSIVGADLMLNSAQIFIAGTTDPTAKLHIAAGATGAGTAPLKFTTGTSMTTAEAGAMEFTTDDLFFTITTGAARKRLVMADAVGGLTAGRVAYVGTNGRLVDDLNFTFSTGLGIGASGSDAFALNLGGGYTAGVLGINSATATISAGNIGTLFTSNGTLVEAGSGNHSVMANTYLTPPAFTVGAATITDAATLVVSAPTTAVVSGTNSSILVQTGNVRLGNGNLTLATAGNKLEIATGSNASIGVSAAMTAGTITISTTAVSASSKIFLMHATVAGAQGILSVGTIVDGTSFVINSSSALDTGSVNYIIIN